MELLSYFHKKNTYLIFLFLAATTSLYFLLPNNFSLDQKQLILIFLFAVVFWAFEIIPLYATSLCVVLFLTFFLTGLEIGERKEFVSYLVPFSSPVIMLFLGGFILAAAIKKYSIDLFLSHKILSAIKPKPVYILFSYLFTSAFFSMWISNTAACAMMLALTKPVLKAIKKNDPFQKALPLAVAFGSNIGGIATPIGTPPNAIAVGILQEYSVYLDFLGWMMMALPLTLFILIVAGGTLLFFFPSKEKSIEIKFDKIPQFSRQAKGVLFIGSLIILAWLTTPLHHIPEGITALFGVALFTAFKLIDHHDLKNVDWDILILMWGGLALGQGIQSTTLMAPLLNHPLFAQQGFLLIAVLCVLAFMLSSFISNTATANLLLPFAVTLTGKDPILISITVALSCSLALAFPISTPPNTMAYSLRTFATKDMFKSGIVISIIAIITILLGFDYFISKSFNLN